MLAASRSPLDTYRAYVRAMQARNGNPNLPIYTQDTQAMMARHTVTPAQMDNVAKSLAHCSGAEMRIADRYAVVRFPVAKRQCPPYFLVYEDGAWKLNLTMMSQALRFNHRNEWRFGGGYDTLLAATCMAALLGYEAYGIEYVPLRYDGMAIDVDEIGLFFAYPWPEEQELIQALFDAVAGEGAILIAYYSAREICVYRKMQGQGQV